MVDATEDKALAERLQVLGFPTLLSFEADGAVVEYDGDRSAASLTQFARRAPPSLLSRRRGYLASDGSLQPSQLDALLRTPHDVGEILRVALDMSPVATACLALLCFLVGALAARACAPRERAQFLSVECPENVSAGQRFKVQVSEKGFLGRPRALYFTVQAPIGIEPGKSFVVPLVAPPVARAIAGAVAGGSAAASPAKKSD